ncbi:MAG TPA: N-formylglutamate amidohydrolase [Aestuariivirga sp.]|nr:N-formylglutamate amidohydrolase [Aestuariivirga sp.]
MGGALLEGEEGPAILLNEQGKSSYVLICEHASNHVPTALGSLGLTASDLQRHIAWDIGAENVARILSKLMDAPLILQRYSRLAYDCNRPPESPQAIPAVSETTNIPGNTHLSAAERLARIQQIYRPFHAAVSGVLDTRAAGGQKSVVISIHSFTPIFKGKPRAVELGILHDRDATFSSSLVKRFPKVDARLNEPYGPKDGVLHTLNLHAAPRGLKHAMIEIRNDLVSSTRRQEEWAQRLSVPLIQATAALSRS